MGIIAGIDLGTTTSEIAYLKDGEPCAIKNKMCGSEFTPSIVGINENIKELKVGRRAECYPPGIVGGIKRIMGETIKVKMGEKEYSPEEITSMILKYIKEYAEDYLNDELKNVIIAVPPGFSAEAKKATDAAAESAGLRVIKLLDEPLAAALAFGINKKDAGKKILVFDLGGRTFNVSIVGLENKSINLFANEGSQYLGGINFDQRIIECINEHLSTEYRFNDINDDLEYKILIAAKKAKEDLSASASTVIEIPFIGIVNNKIINFKMELHREKFNQITIDLVDQTITGIDLVLQSAGLDKSEIHKVLLVGGSTRIPRIKEKVEEYFGFPPSAEVEPDLAVSFGAALYGGMITGDGDSIRWI